MQRISMKAEKRGNTEGRNNQLRAGGKIPAIVYGKSIEGSMSIQIDEKEFVLNSRKGLTTLIFDLDVDGKKLTTIVKDNQKHILTRKFQHVDFLSIDLADKIEAVLPLVLQGDAKGVKIGGRLEQRMYKVKVSGQPEKIPHEIVVDVTNIDLGATLQVKDLTPPEGLVFTSIPNDSILIIKAPKAAAETPAATK